MNCYNCDTLLENNWNYCPNCKRKLRKNKIVEEEFVVCNEVGRCHTCSCELSDSWNFCPVCGTSADFYSEKPSVVLPTIATNTENKPTVVASLPDAKLEEDVVVQNTVNEKRCPNCGAIVTEEHLFCASCGNALGESNTVVKEETNDGNGFILWLIVAYITPVLGLTLTDYIHEIFGIICGVVSLISIVYVKATYPNNKIVGIFFWLYIVLVAIAIAVVLFVYLFLVAACNYCIEAFS